MEQLSMPVAEVLRDVGMTRAVEHANRVVPGWSDAALAYVKAYCLRTEGLFTAEMIVASYDAAGHIQPASTKAWGSVMQRAQREGLMVRKDFEGRRAKGHASPCGRYQSMIVGRRYSEVVG